MSLGSTMGHGVVGVEIICESCNEYINLIYSYYDHYYKGTCPMCRLHYLVDLEVLLRGAMLGMYGDWDAALREL